MNHNTKQLSEAGEVLSSTHAQSWKRTLVYQGKLNSDGSLHPLGSNSLFTGYIVHYESGSWTITFNFIETYLTRLGSS